jgi:hypothetical protein
LRFGEAIEGLVEGDELVIGDGGRDAVGIEVLPVSVAAALDGLTPAGLLDEDAPDRLGRRGEEMAFSLESLVASCTSDVASSVCPGCSRESRAAASLRSSL